MGNSSSKKKEAKRSLQNNTSNGNKNEIKPISTPAPQVHSDLPIIPQIQNRNVETNPPSTVKSVHSISTIQSKSVHIHSKRTREYLDAGKVSQLAKEQCTSDHITKYLNTFGFINYNHYGQPPWYPREDSFLPTSCKFPTPFLGIDCEMVGVGSLKASTLGRVSIVNEYGYCIYDRFVKPQEEVTDYRTPFSGIRPEDLVNADSKDKVVKEVKEIVQGNVLVGHAIHNDLEVLDLNDYPQNMVRDTAIYFQKLLGSKHTLSLKFLIDNYFGIHIQDGEHSSIQDAQATLKLYLINRVEWEQSLVERREKANLVNVNISHQIKTPPLDIADMNVYPREKDIFADTKTVFVRENKIIGAYSSSEEYLDVQFRLIREDLLRPLREGVIDAKLQSNQKLILGTPKPGTIFNAVRIQGEGIEVKRKQILRIPVAQNNLGDVDWKETKLFMNGQLILISPDRFNTVKFATIIWRPNENKDSYSSFFPLTVQFDNHGPSWITKEGSRFQMMESTAFYEAYRHTLEYLQVVKLDTFPLKKYIVDAEMRPSLPLYVRNTNVPFDFSVFFKKDSIGVDSVNQVKALDFKNWPNAEELKLNLSQYEAFQKAITQELTIIQGPPGTGKTFLGVQIVKFLVSNPKLLKTPILIVSYTNHALDEFLERVLDFVEEDICSVNKLDAHQLILRMGGGSTSKRVEPLCLTYKRDKNAERNNLKEQLQKLQQPINQFVEFEHGFSMGIVDFLQFPPEIIQELSKRCPVAWNDWKDHITRIREVTPSLFGWWHGFEGKFPIRPKNGISLFPYEHRDYELQREHVALPKIFETLRGSPANPIVAVGVEEKFRAIGFKSNDNWPKYLYIVRQSQIIVEEMKTKAIELKNSLEQLRHIKGVKDSIKSAKIIGMTTTGAVKNKIMILNSFKSQVMIVEEAAHVLEAHVVASLTQHCQQLIMIGDHKQLRPMTADSSLAKDYNLEISLMERLVKNGESQRRENWIQLKTQHRMRPEFARLICPVIYKKLENDPSVEKYPPVKGCKKNLFFIDHTVEEKRERGSSSLVNHHEASFLAKLGNYLVKKGRYDQSEITVIATYADQKNLIQKNLNDLGCANIRVSTVDGYQGEENVIILLSLVRSNEQNAVGFLKTDNRVCVALSRAREGFFMMGNMSCLKKSSETWSQINNILRQSGSIGKELLLKCPEHPNNESRASKAKDFNKISSPSCCKNQKVSNDSSVANYDPENQEMLKEMKTVCTMFGKEVSLKTQESLKLRCGHQYDFVANQKPPEDTIKCSVIMERILQCGHKQKAPCYINPSIINCTKMLIKTLPCGHQTPRMIYCSQKLSDVKCIVPVPKVLPCGHNQKAHCHLSESKIRCQVQVPGCRDHLKISCSEIPGIICYNPVPRHLECGHNVVVPCGKPLSDIKCISSVVKSLPCGHQLNSMCHVNEADIICSNCEHLKDVARSETSASTCKRTSLKMLPCGHKPKARCGTSLSEIKCNSIVIKSLACGHKQNVPCGVDESKINCSVLVAGCKDHEKVMCGQRSRIICYNIVSRLLDCGHKAVVPCSKLISEIKCISLVLKYLSCGHQKNVDCRMDTSKIKCQVPGCMKHSEPVYSNNLTQMLKCGHQAEISCSKNISEVKCISSVLKTLPCGHQQKGPCYLDESKIICPVRVSGCKDHQSCYQRERSGFTCNKIVTQLLECGHKSEVLCSSSTHRSEMKCNIVVAKSLSCGHTQNHPCHHPISQIKCGLKVNKTLPCGHKYKIKLHCHQSIPPQVKCQAPVSVSLPKCNHKIEVECFKREQSVSHIVCKSECKNKFKCGHQCRLPCHVNNNHNHEAWKCVERCVRKCPRGHQCPGDHLCHSSCKMLLTCTVKFTDMLYCSHYRHTSCHEYTSSNASRDKPCEICPLKNFRKS